MSRAIIAFGNISFKFGVFNRVIFDVDSQSFLAYFLRRALGDRPGCQRPVDLKSEIKMQAAGGVPLNHENGIFIFTNAAFGFGSLWKLSLAIVFFQCGHSVLVNDYKVL